MPASARRDAPSRSRRRRGAAAGGGLGRDVGEHVERRTADVGGDGQARHDATLQTRDAHHEEFVEVAGEDGEEVRPLQDRHGGVFGELEHALVERQPAQLAVEVAVVGQLVVLGLDGLVEVVVVGVAEPASSASCSIIPTSLQGSVTRE